MKISHLYTLLAISASETYSFIVVSPSSSVQPKISTFFSSTRLHLTATDVIQTLSTSQTNTVQTIASTIPDLVTKPNLSWSNQPIGQTTASLDARDAPGPSNIAWLASVTIPNTLSSLTIFNGPLTYVPHLLSRVMVHADSNTMTLALDFRPRSYGAFELSDEERGPDKLGRASFTYSGNRKEYETNFATPDVVDFLHSIVSSVQGGNVLPTNENEYESLTKGPHFLKLSMPITDHNLKIVTEAREQAAMYWLKWATEGKCNHRPGAPVNSQYVYDTKYRLNAYLALLPVYNDVFGSVDGPTLTAAESGPLDEAYVGGGS